MTPLLQIQNLSVGFRGEEGTALAVKNVSLTVNRGEIVALVGESGSGKSVTSLSVLRLLPQPPAVYPQGEILFPDEGKPVDLLTLDEASLRRVRGGKIAMVFQEPMTSLNPVLRCGEQVMEALLAHKQMTAAEAKAETLAWLDRVKLPSPEAVFQRYPHQLSGGQKQRVMIAMAMCCRPQLLICDEPTTALDVTVQKTILQLIKELQRQQGMGVVFITHDLGVVAEVADRVVMLYKGEVVEEGPVRSLFTAAKHPYTQALIACRPALHPKGERLPTVADFLGKAEKENETQEGNSPHAGNANQNATSVSTTSEAVATPNQSTQPQTPNAKPQTSPSDTPLVQVQNLTVRYPAKTSFFGRPKTFFTAVNDVSFDIRQNETLGLVGESGCGKTTLGRTLVRLIEPSSGRILYKGNDITKLSAADVKRLRKDVQLVFQDPYSSLNPRLTIEEALAEPLQVAGLRPTARERRQRVAELLEKVSLPTSAMRRYPHEFSGGQRQRIVIARALSLEPDFVVCDESVSALDVSVQAQVLNLLNDLKRDLGLTLLFISHDLSVVRYFCDRVLVMQAGAIVESGEAETLYRLPTHAYTQTLLAAVPKVNP